MSDNLKENQPIIEELNGVAFLAFPEMQGMLKSELSNRLGFDSKPTAVYGDLLYYEDYPKDGIIPYWCKSAMLNPKRMTFTSIGTAAKDLKSIQRKTKNC